MTTNIIDNINFETINQPVMTLHFANHVNSLEPEKLMMRNVLHLCQTCVMASRQSYLLRQYRKISTFIKTLL